jgi:ATP-dependent helicase HrpB
MSTLPVDQVLPRLLDALRTHPAVILVAPPGSGKTTRVPLALLDAPFLRGGRIVMLEPRRLAASNAARWMAGRLGEEAGQTVGYQVRFEKKTSSATRIEVVTEGVLARRLHADPSLEGVGAVIFDEFHERSLQSDLCLALCRDVQLGLRDDLKLIVMSATIDPAPISVLLDDAPVVSCSGRSFPVDLRYGGESGGDPAREASRAVCRAVRETAGDILVFLPGAGEIRRCETLLRESLGEEQLLISPLYGDLPFDAQERAIMPASRRRAVLATNIAETSLTIEGVSVVVDSGWCRRLRFDPARGLNRLVTERISAASADQRAGRAGRLGPGVCYRLWSEHQQRALLAFQPPEILTADLAPLALDLALWGVRDATSLAWLDPPPPAALAEARRLLVQLEALDPEGPITPTGRRMADLPLHPRLGHLILTAIDRGLGSLGCDLAALLSERDIFRSTGRTEAAHVSDSDLLDRVEALAAWRAHGGGDALLDRQACRGVDRVARQLRALVGVVSGAEPASAEEVGILLALTYPDRIARQRAPGSDRYLLASGLGGRLAPQSAVRDHPFIVAVSLEGEREGDVVIRQASCVSLAGLRSEFGSAIERRRTVVWDEGEGRVVAREEERLRSLVLASSMVTPEKGELHRAFLEGLAAGPGIAACTWSPAALQFVARVRFLARHFPGEWPDLSEERLNATLPEWLGPFVHGIRSRAELGRIDLLPALRALLGWEQARRLDEGAPTEIAVPSGSRIRVDYLPEEGPVLAVKLQELFGLGETPRVAWGRVPLLLHLLSPAGRPIQVTRDLRNFWNTAYSEVKRELRGRYPKHPWPDDPWTAVPTRHTKKRGG